MLRSRPMRELRASVAVAEASMFWLTPVAQAASNPGQGVHVDPGSPAGKQYAIPNTSARGETLLGGGGGLVLRRRI